MRIAVGLCKTCKKRPRAFSKTEMCKSCIDRLFAPDLVQLDTYLTRWYTNENAGRS